MVIEEKHGHGAKKIRSIRRYIHRRRRGIAKASQPFDWTQEYDSTALIPQVTIKNQFLSDSCGGQAGSYLVEVIEKLAGSKEGAISAKTIYAPIAYPGGGTTVIDLERQLNASGSDLEAIVPSYMPDGTTDEAWMTDKTYLTAQIVEDEMARAGYQSVSVSIDMDSIAWAIKTYGAVIVEIEGQNNGTWDSPNPQPPVGSRNLWRHFMCWMGAVQFNGNAFKAFQSWGLSVGLSGMQFFNENYIDSGHILDVIAFYKPVQQPVSPIIASKPSAWAMLLSWIESLFKPVLSGTQSGTP